MLFCEPSSGWNTWEKASYSEAWAMPSALASFAPRPVTAVENAGSSPGRPAGHSEQSASSTLRTASPAILRQKLIGVVKALDPRTCEHNANEHRGRLRFGQTLGILDRPWRHFHR